MFLFEIRQRFKGHFLNELRVSFKKLFLEHLPIIAPVSVLGIHDGI